MKKTFVIGVVVMLLGLMSGCSGSKESKLVGAWAREGDKTAEFVLYDDKSCEIDNSYGTGTWAIKNDDLLTLTDFYGQESKAKIKELSKDRLVLIANEGTEHERELVYTKIEKNE